jgi:RND family efflux transporter MFP subunit
VRKLILAIVVVVALGGGSWYYRYGGADPAAATPGTPAPGGGAGGRGGSGGGRAALSVDTAVSGRQDIVDYITVVGNLIGEATVDVTPRVGGRIETIAVRMGDRVTKGQQIAKMDDRDVAEQVKQAQASLEVNRATATARENDLKVAQSTFGRAQIQAGAGLMAKQGLEDAESRYNAAGAQVEVARAQASQTQARIDELKITFANTSILSPVDGFVSRRNLDPGAFAGTNTVIVSVVDIDTVRLVANLVEKDFKRVKAGVEAHVGVDAFPGETFPGKVSRVAPVFDPATRTATMEIEVPNGGFRLKPGMFARVQLIAERRMNVLVVPRAAIVDVEGQRGVFIAEGPTAKFRAVETGLQDGDRIEIVGGLQEKERVVTVGALALRDGDRIAVIGQGGRGGRGGRGPAPGGTPPPGK